MVKKVSTSDARAHFGDIVNSVYYSKEAVAVEKKGKVLAVLISPERFQRLQEADDRNWEIVQGVWDRLPDRDPDEILADVVEEEKDRRANDEAAIRGDD